MSTYAIAGSIGALIFLLTMGYIFLMLFFPEWVGMSGEDTRKTLESHKQEDENSKSET